MLVYINNGLLRRVQEVNKTTQTWIMTACDWNLQLINQSKSTSVGKNQFILDSISWTYFVNYFDIILLNNMLNGCEKNMFTQTAGVVHVHDIDWC